MGPVQRCEAELQHSACKGCPLSSLWQQQRNQQSRGCSQTCWLFPCEEKGTEGSRSLSLFFLFSGRPLMGASAFAGDKVVFSLPVWGWVQKAIFLQYCHKETKDVNLPGGSHLKPRVVTEMLCVPGRGPCVTIEPAAGTIQAQILSLSLCYYQRKWCQRLEPGLNFSLPSL